MTAPAGHEPPPDVAHRAVLLLHGLGAGAGVWAPVREVLADRAPDVLVLAPDLPGHGGAASLDHYSFGTMAAAVATAVQEAVPAAPGELTVVGHSLGGVVGLALASGWFRLPVSSVLAVGIRTVWVPEDLQRAAAVAQRPVAWFDTRDEALSRYARFAGLRPEQLSAVDPEGAVVESGGRYRLAQDPRTFGVGAPDLRSLLAAAAVPVVLAAGEHDAGADPGAIRVGGGLVFEGTGHNAHVEAPQLVASAVLDVLARQDADRGA